MVKPAGRPAFADQGISERKEGHMPRSRLWALIALVGALAAGLIVAGCGGDDDEGVDTGDIETLKSGVLTVGSDIPFPPFEQGDPPDYEGFDIDVINEIADRLELEIEIVDMPFDVVLAGGKGRYDAAIAATTIKPGRENKVDFSDPYFEASQGLLVPAGGDVASIGDLGSDSVIGAQDGTTGETYAEENTEAEVRPFPEIDDAYTALANGQVDAVLNDLPSVATAVDANPDLEVVETFATEELYGILFPEESDPLREAVNDALQDMKDDGTLEEIFREWFDEEISESLLEATHEPS